MNVMSVFRLMEACVKVSTFREPMGIAATTMCLLASNVYAHEDPRSH